MRRFLSGLGIALCAGFAVSPAGQALPYSGRLTLELTPGLPLLVISAFGTGESEGLGGAVRLPGGPGVAGSHVLTDLGPAAIPIVTLRAEAALSRASFAPGAGPGGGLGSVDEPLSGSLRLGLFGPPPIAFLSFPLGAIGVEGALLTRDLDLDVHVSALGHGWTTGMAKFIGQDFPVTDVTLASATGADLRTPGGLGGVVFVAPTVVRTNVAGSQNIALVARLELTFVPEPGTLALLGVGLFGLGAMGKRRGMAR